MDNDNYLDIPASARDGFVYRIISVQHLLELFETKQNVLLKPRKWEDPFENFILSSRVQLPTGELATFGFRDCFYGQCWTLQSASDAMWRIYSPKLDAVRIRSTVRKLGESLSRARGDWAHDEAFIGRVQYLPNEKLMAFAKNAFRGMESPSARMFAKTLLVKRPAFKHEREVRLLFFQRDKVHAQKDLLAYPVDPHEFVEQIMIHPRMHKQEANTLRQKIKAKTGFHGPIKRSLLYAPPPDLVLPFNGLSPVVRRTRQKRRAADL